MKGDCQFEAMLECVAGKHTLDGLRATSVEDLRLLSSEYLLLHRHDPMSSCGVSGKIFTWEADILAAVPLMLCSWVCS
jgi:hypothetical protein